MRGITPVVTGSAKVEDCMQTDDHGNDIRAIEAVITRQFASVNWTPATTPDWTAFAADFFPDASLYPSSRPAQRQTVQAFIDRMNGAVRSKLQSFREAVLGTEIRVFGNIATVIVVCEMTEDDTEVHRNVEMLLLVKSKDAWQIVAQAWDTEGASKPMPSQLLARRSAQ